MNCTCFIGKDWDAMLQSVLTRGWSELWPEIVTDFQGFTNADLVNGVVQSACALVTPGDVNNVADAPSQPLAPQEVLEIMEEEAASQKPRDEQQT